MERKEYMTKELNNKQKTVSKNRWLKSLVANISLIILGLAVSISGLIIQVHYHIGHSSNTSTVLSFDRITWYYIHVYTSIVFFLVVVYHIWLHKKWYKNIFSQNCLPNKRATMILTILMIITTITGFTPLFMCFIERGLTFRFAIVEIHDKIAILFLLVAFFHTKKRFVWYANTLRNKLKK